MCGPTQRGLVLVFDTSFIPPTPSRQKPEHDKKIVPVQDAASLSRSFNTKKDRRPHQAKTKKTVPVQDAASLFRSSKRAAAPTQTQTQTTRCQPNILSSVPSSHCLSTNEKPGQNSYIHLHFPLTIPTIS